MLSIFPINVDLSLKAFHNIFFFQLAIRVTDRYLMDSVLMDFPL